MLMNDYNILKNELLKQNIVFTDKQIEMFRLYFDLLIEWNQKINLTSICEFEDVIYKHFIDSLSIMKYSDLNGMSVIDIGTGGGFPGIPLAIMNSNSKFVLLDSLNKRINFLNIVIEKLGLTNVNTIHGRAEDFAFDKKYREKFDIATSRAVANLSTLSEYCIPFVKVGGYFISFKSEHCEEEVNNAKYAINLLGASIDSVKEYDLNYSDIVNKLIYISKNNQTKNKYPRKAGIPSKEPLGLEK